MSSHVIPLKKVATKVSPLPLHVCISNPMMLKQYHRIIRNADIFNTTVFISICKCTKNILMCEIFVLYL